MGSRLLENYRFPETVNSETVPNGSCEFAGPKLFDGSLGRKCQADGFECFGAGKLHYQTLSLRIKS